MSRSSIHQLPLFMPVAKQNRSIAVCPKYTPEFCPKSKVAWVQPEHTPLKPAALPNSLIPDEGYPPTGVNNDQVAPLSTDISTFPPLTPAVKSYFWLYCRIAPLVCVKSIFGEYKYFFVLPENWFWLAVMAMLYGAL